MRGRLARLAIMATLAAVPIGVAAPARAEPAAPQPAAVLDPHLVAINQVVGQIMDISPGRILYRLDATPPRLAVKNRQTGRVTAVPAWDTPGIPFARLVPGGVVFVADRGPELLRWNGRRVIDLGPVDATANVRVRGAYLLWNAGGVLRRLNVTTGRNTLIDANAIGAGSEVLPDGDVLYAGPLFGHVSGPHISRFHAGTITDVYMPTQFGSAPVVDGTTMVYSGTDQPGGVGNGVWLVDSSSTMRGPTTLVPAELVPGMTPQYGTGYETAGGWSAYLRADLPAGPVQVWLRKPNGSSGPVSGAPLLNTDLHLVALSPTGQVLYAVGGTLYLGVLGQDPRPLISDAGDWDSYRLGGTGNTVRFLDNHWYLGAGHTLYVLARRVATPG